MRLLLGASALAIALGCSSAALAANSVQPGLNPLTGAPPGVDWSGVWQTQPGGSGQEWLPAEAPFTPAYKAKQDSLVASQEKGQANFEPAADCKPLGMPRFMSNVYGMEIWHRPGALGIYGEYPGFMRRIFVDGRKMPPLDELDPSYYGYSVGHWEGKDLVVETVAIRGNVLLSRAGVEISDQASVKERFHQVDDNTLTDTMTLTDPKAFTRPWTITKTYKRSPEIDMMEYFCDNNRHPTNADGTVTTILKSN
jgi:hypothetical protein